MGKSQERRSRLKQRGSQATAMRSPVSFVKQGESHYTHGTVIDSCLCFLAVHLSYSAHATIHFLGLPTVLSFPLLTFLTLPGIGDFGACNSRPKV